MLSANFKSEEGSAVLEFIGFGLLLQIPMLALVGNLVSLQHDQLAAEAIVRDVLRSQVLLDRQPSDVALELASAYRVAPSRIQLSVSCEPTDCRQDQTWIRVKAQIGAASATGVIQR